MTTNLCTRGVLAALLAGCTTTPVTGDVVSGATAGYKVPLGGWSDTANTTVTAYVLANPDADPATGVYTAIGSGKTGTVPYSFNSPTPAYSWSFTSQGLTAQQWPAGGLVRLKARSKYHGSSTAGDMATFDTFGNACLFSEVQGGSSWIAAGQDCQSPYALANIITMVSPSPTPAEAHPNEIYYLGMRGGVSPDEPLSPNQQSYAVDNYYTSIGAPATLTAFRTKYGFGTGSAGEVRAVYYNAGDLGVARDMNCNAATVGGFAVKACYVSNYGRSEQQPFGAAGFGPDQLDPQHALNQALGAPQVLGPNRPVATVAMVYDTAKPVDARTQFMVYDELGELSTLAPLDNEGLNAIVIDQSAPTPANLSVPENCLTCHGTSSSYTKSDVGQTVVHNAHFLPFDPDAFEFSTSNADFSKAKMLPKLKQLNALVMDAGPTPAILDLLKGIYPSASGQGPKDASSVFSGAYVPSGWSNIPNPKGPRQLYGQVVKPYCRTCHISHDADGLDWTTFQAFKDDAPAIAYYVCEAASSLPMPQSERTHDRFWRSPARAHLVNALAIGGACAP